MAVLEISNIDPVNTDGFLDSTGGLQVDYNSQNLANYENTLHAMEYSSLPARVKVYDFSDGGNSYTVEASHQSASGTEDWTRSGDHCYYDFGDTDLTAVTVEATSGGTTKTKVIHIKVKPVGSKPDRG